MSPAELKSEYESMGSQNNLSPNRLIQSNMDPSTGVFSLGFSPTVTSDTEAILQNLMDGLSCGF